MVDAYEPVPIVEKLPVQIESIATWGPRLIVGTKQGFLLVYEIQANAPGTGDTPFNVTLLETKRSFAKKPIVKLTVVEEYGLLISLSDNYVHVHELSTFALRTQMAKTKGATYFAVNVQSGADEAARKGPRGSLRLCAVVKKKLELYVWRNNEFLEEKGLTVPDVARTVVWCGDSLCVGFKKEYNLIQTKTGACTELFPTGVKNPEPMVTSLPNNELLLGKDQISIFYGYDGKPARKFGLQWSAVPVALEASPPYVLALLPRNVEIRTIETQFLVQTLDLPGARLVSQGDAIYCASTTHVWRMVPLSLVAQVDQLVKQVQFEEALHLAERIDSLSDADKSAKIRQIRTLHAYHLFVAHRFDQSLAIFGDLNTDPPQVIGLYPGLLPAELRKQIVSNYPITLPELSGPELEKALLALIDFLANKRSRLNKAALAAAAVVAAATTGTEGDAAAAVAAAAAVSSSIGSGTGSDALASEDALMDEVTRRELCQIIDTTLLKCYLQTNDAMVPSLLRVANHCHVGESEKMLRKCEKWSELVMLYQGKGLHRKALELLRKFGEDPHTVGSLAGTQRSVAYMQRLGSAHLELLMEFSRWVLHASPLDGLSIFTGDFPEVDGIPHAPVVALLQDVAPALLTDYLEHIIDDAGEIGAEFHNKRVIGYLERVEQFMKGGVRASPGEGRVRAGTEAGELGALRAKLIAFLERSLYYNPEKMLSRFPMDALYEERAILLGRIARHDRALNIYVHKLNDFEMAEQYCDKHYNRDKEESRDVYVSLLRVYLAPPDGEAPNLPPALTLLANHHSRIDTAKALEMLPIDTPIGGLYPFIESVLVENCRARKRNQVLRALLKSDHLQVQELLQQYQSRRVIITEDRTCPVCTKRIGNSVFACYPNNAVVHHMCKERFEAMRLNGQMKN